MAVRDRVEAHRDRMRAKGFRQIQVWVPDVRSEAFAAEARRQAEAVRSADATSDDQSFVESVSAVWDE